ncbi:uncharacterized protein [Atheta coriaria]|uniref:uncharacterized protein n=1 Tax=Dalotia coriaria TaxID=877792 RepID=UPI0031F36959
MNIKDTDSNEINETWEHLKTVLNNTAKEILGTCKRQKSPEWFDEQCREAIETRNETYSKYLQVQTRDRKAAFRQARREADKVCRLAKRTFENNQVEIMEKDFRENETRSAYKYLKRIRDGYKPHTTLCRDQTGQIISDLKNILDAWKTHFEDLLNGTDNDDNLTQTTPSASQTNENENEDNYNYSNVDISPPTIEELEEAIQAQKNNKSPGIDGIPAEIYKHGGRKLLHYLHKLMVNIWEKEKIPDELTKNSYNMSHIQERETSSCARTTAVYFSLGTA